jgi:hypothetical protein
VGNYIDDFHKHLLCAFIISGILFQKRIG